ncbi:hypothetical protein [Escherichia coli]|uniref:hypothetical protein n=1 Tax=Escherichia coli TaxID=562 RepID=UPI0035E3FFFA
MTGEAALRAGACLVRVLTRSEHIAPLPDARHATPVHVLAMVTPAHRTSMGDVWWCGSCVGHPRRGGDRRGMG